jgi:hypothetical protein
MRHRLGLLGTTTSLLLAAAVVTAAPAEARRNVGGITGTCVEPGAAVVEAHGTGLGAPCICIVAGTSVLFGANGSPDGKCPPGLLQQPKR